jgi:hypothetical protein
MKEIDHYQLATDYAERIVDNMDIGDLMAFVIEVLETQYQNDYTKEQLVNEVLEYQPDLLED